MGRLAQPRGSARRDGARSRIAGAQHCGHLGASLPVARVNESSQIGQVSGTSTGDTATGRYSLKSAIVQKQTDAARPSILECLRWQARNVMEADEPEDYVQINERIVGDVAIVEVIGDIVGTSGDARLQDKVSSLRQQGYKQVLVDLGKVAHMDSEGLGDLVLAYARIRKSGGTLKLMRVTKRLQDLLTITKLVSVFDTYDDETAAVASFSAAA